MSVLVTDYNKCSVSCHLLGRPSTIPISEVLPLRYIQEHINRGRGEECVTLHSHYALLVYTCIVSHMNYYVVPLDSILNEI